MADFGSPVAQNVQAPNPIQTLSGLLSLQQQKQQLQTGQYLQQTAQADAQKQQQAMQERMRMAQMLRSGVDDQGNSIRDANGEPDPAKVLPALGRIAPLTGQDTAQAIIKTITDKTGLQEASTRLDAAQRQLLMGPVQAAVLDTSMGSSEINAGLENLRAKHPEMGNAIDYMEGLTPHLDQIKDPAQRAAAVNKLAARLQMGQPVQTQPTGASLDVGPSILTGAVAPPAAGGGFSAATAAPKGIAPGRQPYTDASGQTFTFNPQTGNYEPAKTAPSRQVGASEPGALEAIKNQTDANFANVNANREAANSAPQQLDQIRNALNIARTANTGGDWTAQRARIESNLATVIPGLKGAQDDATKIQVLDKFLTRVTNDSNKVLGNNASTDAERASIERQNAQVGYTPDAIKKVLQYAQAQTLAMQAKGNAQEQWLKQPGHGITNHQDFETAWRQAYDPVLFQLQGATPAERAELIGSLPPEEAQGLAAKKSALEALGVSFK